MTLYMRSFEMKKRHIDMENRAVYLEMIYIPYYIQCDVEHFEML